MFRFVSDSWIVHFLIVCLGFKAIPGPNFTQLLHLYFTRVAIVSLAEKIGTLLKYKVIWLYQLSW